MSRRRTRAFAIGASLAAVMATNCTLLVSTGDLTSGASSNPDSGAGDVARDAPADTTIIPAEAATIADGGDARDAEAVAIDSGVVFPGNGHRYVVVSSGGPFSWAEANTRAEALGGHIAAPNTEAEDVFVFGLVSGVAAGSWLGGYQATGSQEPAGGWAWITGEPMTYTNWSPGQPNNLGGGESVLHYLSSGTRAWSDEDEDAKYGAFVVEIE